MGQDVFSFSLSKLNSILFSKLIFQFYNHGFFFRKFFFSYGMHFCFPWRLRLDFYSPLLRRLFIQFLVSLAMAYQVCFYLIAFYKLICWLVDPSNLYYLFRNVSSIKSRLAFATSSLSIRYSLFLCSRDFLPHCCFVRVAFHLTFVFPLSLF